MRKIQTAAAIAIAAGFLLAGVGTGVCFAELGSMEYAGHTKLYEEEMTTGRFSFELPDTGDKKILLDHFWWGGIEQEREIDNTLPEGQVVYEVTYNQKFFEPKISYQDFGSEAPFAGELRLRLTRKESDMEGVFAAKDRILSDLRQGKMGSYEISYVDRVVIKASQETFSKKLLEQRDWELE